MANREIIIPEQGPESVYVRWRAADGIAGCFLGGGMATLGDQVEAPSGAEGHLGKIDDQVGRMLIEAVIQRGLQSGQSAQVDFTSNAQHDDLTRSAGQ